MIRKVKEFYFKDWDNPETGQVVSENNEWFLIRSIPVDYVIDGFKVFKKSHISDIISPEDSYQIEKVLKLRNVTPDILNDFSFGTTIELLSWIEKKYGIFEFTDLEEESIFIGKIKKYDDESLLIDFIDSDGKIDVNYDSEFKLDEIRILSFDSDYFNAIKLLWENY